MNINNEKKNKIPAKIMNNTMMASWVLNLIKRHQNKGICTEEEKAFIKSKFILCAEDQGYKLNENDLKELDNKINIMYN